jgi:hypothetical protein
MIKPRFDPYAVLGVTPGASQDEIRDRYRILAHLLHPDRHQSAPSRVIEEAERHLREVNEAYRLLSTGRHVRDAPQHDVQLRQAREREAQLRQALERQAGERHAQRRRRRYRWVAASAGVVACVVLAGFLFASWDNNPDDATAGDVPAVTPSPQPSIASVAPTRPPSGLGPGSYPINREIGTDGTWTATLADIELDERSRVRVAVAYRNVSATSQPFACDPTSRRNVYLTLAGGGILHAQRILCSSSSAEQLSAPGGTQTTWAEFGRISAGDVPFSLSWYPARWGTVTDISL